ncbi:MAG: hypothetical protein LIO59_06085 [Oscillospiraceae bacterium]|nr:hypothetical protein [Oscillospiraceae bacterium]
MNKIFTAVIIFICALTSSAYAASDEYDKIFADRLKELGAFDGSSGITYGSIEHFADDSDMLFIAYLQNNSVCCEIYNDSDGIQRTDELSFPYAVSVGLRMYLANSDNYSYLVVTTTQGKTSASEFFTVVDDNFKRTVPVSYDNITSAAGFENGIPTAYDNTKQRLYDFLNSLKLSKINSMRLHNRIDEISVEQYENIRALLTACADIMKFDIDNYDYDTLMKYILCTHDNFRLITGLDPQTSSMENTPGFEDVLIVNADYIDYILTAVFKMPPEHPPVNALVSRGYCYTNGVYYYKNIFNVDFSTDIRDLIGVYNLGGGIFYVIFTDIYHEGNNETFEYSFAVIRQNEEPPYSLLRIGMGENLLTENEITEYTPQKTYQNPIWQTPEPGYNAVNSPLSTPILLIIISVGSVMFIIGIIIIIKELWNR